MCGLLGPFEVAPQPRCRRRHVAGLGCRLRAEPASERVRRHRQLPLRQQQRSGVARRRGSAAGRRCAASPRSGRWSRPARSANPARPSTAARRRAGRRSAAVARLSSSTGARRRRRSPSRRRTRPRSRRGRACTSKAAVTVVGRPSASRSRSPTRTSPIVVQPCGVGSGVSRASALPRPGRPATMISWPACRPLSSRSRSAKPVGTPVIIPPESTDRLDLVQRRLEHVGQDREVLVDPALGDVVDGLLGQVDDVVHVPAPPAAEP